MGFSVSGSAVLLLLGLFVALSTFYASGANTMERLTGAEADRADRVQQVHETDINVTAVTVTDSTNCDVEVRVNNTGSTDLSVNRTDLLLDNGLTTDWQDGATVDGDADTELWLPGERLVVTRSGLASPPDSVQFVTAAGVTDRRTTGGLSCS